MDIGLVFRAAALSPTLRCRFEEGPNMPSALHGCVKQLSSFIRLLNNKNDSSWRDVVIDVVFEIELYHWDSYMRINFLLQHDYQVKQYKGKLELWWKAVAGR